ncbi:uncharacterized protein CLIB1444_04S05820 [[Candida] jaroonii]|uniref:Uncharacterized protein n=1 Tax=[Candida] jaroonii TaxID=467808 RepID=A0ACA9Y7F6_9ASCO|nr:uncharacterized protein CLIB1444_04S05820 [[Candida] jaroonii]
MSDFEQEELDNPLRVIILLNPEVVNDEGLEKESKDSGKEESEESEIAPKEIVTDDLTERLMDYVQTMEEVDEFFNEFDDKIAYPNEGHIKYEVGSDGLVVILVDTADLRDKVVKFIDEFNEKDEPKRKR